MPNKVDNNCWLEGFSLVHLRSWRYSNAAGLEEKKKNTGNSSVLFWFFGFFFLVLGLCLYFSALVRFPGCFAVLWMLSKRFLRVEHIRLLSVETCLTSSLRTLWAKPTPFTPFGFQNSTAIFWLCLAESVDSVRGSSLAAHNQIFTLALLPLLCSVSFYTFHT